MALVSKNIPNLINGVSQQPPSLRLSSQGEAQENGLSDVVDGLKKRPPTQFIKKLTRCSSSWSTSTAQSASTGNLTSSNVQNLTESELNAAYTHTYKRSGDEQYLVVILPHATTPILLVYDIDGNLRYESNKSSWLADGSNITYPTETTVAAASIAHSDPAGTVTITFSSAHPFSVGETVTISQVTGKDKGIANRTTTVASVTSTTFTYTIPTSEQQIPAGSSTIGGTPYVVGGVTTYNNSDDTSYLIGLGGTAINKEDITSTSIADATFIVNKNTVVERSDFIDVEDDSHDSLVYLKSVNYGRTYQVKLTSREKKTTVDSKYNATTINQGHNVNNQLSGDDVQSGESNSAQTKNNELQVSKIVNALKGNLLHNFGVTANIIGTRAYPKATYREVFSAPKKRNDSRVTATTFRFPDTFWPFGSDNHDAAHMAANPVPTNAATNKYNLRVKFNGKTLPHNRYDLFTADGVAGIIVYGGHTDTKHAGAAWQRDNNKNYKSNYIKYSGMIGGTAQGRIGFSSSGYSTRPCLISACNIETQDDSVSFSPPNYNRESYFVIESKKTEDDNETPFGDYDIIATDDDGGSNLRVFKEIAKSFTELPNQCVEGFRIAVVGDNQKKEDNFHVVFEGAASAGVWKETAKAGIKNHFDLATMPHTLRQDPDQTGSLMFSFAEGDWDSRVCGDDDTNAMPSFVDSTIEDIFFHRNRLGILSGENVCFSEANSYFNFFRTTVRTLLDSAPIDVAVSQNEVSILKAAIPTQDSLLLFSELNQFALQANQLLTPTEVSIDQTTRFECDLTAAPVGVGNSVFFGTRTGNFSGVREYYTEQDADIKNATLVTSHCPEYIKGKITKLVTSSNEDTLICLTDNNKKEIYIYKWYDSAKERLQSSWSRWSFSKDVIDIAFNNSDLYITFKDASYEKLNLRPVTSDTTFSNIVQSNVVTGISSFTATGSFSDLVSVNSTLAAINITPPTGKVSLLIPNSEVSKFTVNSTDLLLGDATKTLTDAESGWYEYVWSKDASFFSGLQNQAVSMSVTLSKGIVFEAKSHNVLLDGRVKIQNASYTTSNFDADKVVYGWGATTQFISYKGDVLGTGVSDAVRAKVVASIYQKQHTENGASVNSYFYAGVPYEFKYQLSEQVFEPAQNDVSSLGRFQLRNMTLNFNNTGTFKIKVDSTGREPTFQTYTGRTLGKEGNILGYSSVVDKDSYKFGIQSQAKETDITITNDSHLPCVLENAEWEAWVTLRNRRI